MGTPSRSRAARPVSPGLVTAKRFSLRLNRARRARHWSAARKPWAITPRMRWSIALMACTQIALGAAAERPIEVTLSLADAGTPFPHFWEVMFGSGEAVLALRDNYRKDLRQVKAATDFKYVRFHAIFHDVVGLYDEDESGKPVYNFSYVDQIYDGLLAAGVRPMVELSFMPKKLAADPKNIFGFW